MPDSPIPPDWRSVARQSQPAGRPQWRDSSPATNPATVPA